MLRAASARFRSARAEVAAVTPALLWHYRSLAGEGHERTRRLLLERQMWFSSIDDFNDPFEARVTVTMDASEERWQAEFGVGRPGNERLQTLVNEVQQGLRTDAARLGMFCLSRKNDDILMWSHYADHHRGICLGFSTGTESIFGDAQPVTYSDMYPSFNYFDTTPEQRARLILLTKAAHWAYEEEWRVFRSSGHGIELFPAGMLVHVVIGSETSSTAQADIIEWAAAVVPRILVHKARRDGASFRLIVEPVA
jgi:hypothetical protein